MKRVIDFLGSMSFGLILLLVIAFVSAIGAFIPQERGESFYVEKYGTQSAGLLHALGLTNIYKSFYFVGLLIILSLSLLTCVLKRTRFIVGIFRMPRDFPNRRTISAMSEGATIEGVDLAFASEVLRRHRYSVIMMRKKGGGHIIANRGRVGRVGSLVVHISFVVIVLGGIIGGCLGHKQLLIIFEGEGVYMPEELGHELILYADKVEEIRDPNSGMIEDYITTARLLRGDELAAEAKIEVNHPMEYKGINIFQEHMGVETGVALFIQQQDEGLEEEERSPLLNMEVILRDKSYRVALYEGETKQVDGGYELTIDRYYSRFILVGKTPTNDNPQPNPAVSYTISKNGEVLERGYSFEAYADFHTDHADMGGDISVHFIGTSLSEEATQENLHFFALDTEFPFPGSGERAVLHLISRDKVEMEEGNLPPGSSTNAEEMIVLEVGGEQHPLPLRKDVLVEIDDESYRVSFEGPREAVFTGLTAVYDPGLWFFFVGGAMLSLGTVLVVLVNHKQVKALVEEKLLYIGAGSHRAKDLFSGEFKKLCKEISGGRER